MKALICLVELCDDQEQRMDNRERIQELEYLLTLDTANTEQRLAWALELITELKKLA